MPPREVRTLRKTEVVNVPWRAGQPKGVREYCLLVTKFLGTLSPPSFLF